MIYTLIAIVVAGAGSAALMAWSERNILRRGGAVAGLTGMFGLIFTVVAAFAYAGLAWCYIGASYQADIINREYGTHYTQAEVFYASDVIETIRQLQRQRVELNGDLMRAKP